MPIAINGSGTVTGISVGGLPDGIVDTDMLAAAAVTAPKRGAGAILQVVSTTKTDTFSSSSDSFTDLTGLTVNITPVSQTSKFLITAYMNVALPTTSGGASDIGWNSKILRDSTTVVSNAVTSSYGSIYYLQGSSNLHLFDTIIGLDDHNTTSQVTIKVQGREPEGNTAVLSKGSAANSYLLVQEIET